MACADREKCDRTNLAPGITDLEWGGDKCACYSPIFSVHCDGSPKYGSVPHPTPKDADTCERILAALGTIRQDVRSLLAAVSRLEGNAFPEPSEGPSKEDMQRFLDDWRKKADEAWDLQLQRRAQLKGLNSGDEVTPEDEEDYQLGWAR